MPDIGFILTPALSPLLIGVTVIILCAGITNTKTLTCDGIAVIGKAVLGYGIGVGIGPAGEGIGVKQTSGIAKVHTRHLCINKHKNS